MSNKWILIAIVVLISWLTKVSLDLYYVNQQNLSQLNNSLNQQAQRVANLNDQLVAVQQKQISPHEAERLKLDSEKESDVDIKPYDVNQYVFDRLELIQIALDQQQYNLALQNVHDLRLKLQKTQILSETLNHALIEALIRDQAKIVIYLQQRKEHLQLLQQQLLDLTQLIVPQNLEQKERKWDISTWFTVSKHSNTPDLAQRNLVYKQLQLQLMLAQQALLAGEINLYREQINQVIAQTENYPDLTAQQIIKKLHQVKELNLADLPQMTAIALMKET